MALSGSCERSSERAAVHPAREEGSRESEFRMSFFYEIYSINFLAGYFRGRRIMGAFFPVLCVICLQSSQFRTACID